MFVFVETHLYIQGGVEHEEAFNRYEVLICYDRHYLMEIQEDLNYLQFLGVM